MLVTSLERMLKSNLYLCHQSFNVMQDGLSGCKISITKSEFFCWIRSKRLVTSAIGFRVNEYWQLLCLKNLGLRLCCEGTLVVQIDCCQCSLLQHWLHYPCCYSCISQKLPQDTHVFPFAPFLFKVTSFWSALKLGLVVIIVTCTHFQAKGRCWLLVYQSSIEHQVWFT